VSLALVVEDSRQGGRVRETSLEPLRVVERERAVEDGTAVGSEPHLVDAKVTRVRELGDLAWRAFAERLAAPMIVVASERATSSRCATSLFATFGFPRIKCRQVAAQSLASGSCSVKSRTSK